MADIEAAIAECKRAAVADAGRENISLPDGEDVWLEVQQDNIHPVLSKEPRREYVPVRLQAADVQDRDRSLLSVDPDDHVSERSGPTLAKLLPE